MPPRKVETPFDFMESTEEDRARINKHREAFEKLYRQLARDIKPSRYLSLAFTKLEEAHMMVNKAVVREPAEPTADPHVPAASAVLSETTAPTGRKKSPVKKAAPVSKRKRRKLKSV